MLNFMTVAVDSSTGIAMIGPGNRLGNVALALNDKGRALPHGTCPYVGVGGHSGVFSNPSYVGICLQRLGRVRRIRIHLQEMGSSP
jgi:hypothetical protein